MPAVTLIVCGAPLAERSADLATSLVAAGWETSVIATPAARAWVDFDAVAAATGKAVRLDHRSPSEPKSSGLPDVVVVCPATFNTVNKAISGVSDTYALGVFCE